METETGCSIFHILTYWYLIGGCVAEHFPQSRQNTWILFRGKMGAAEVGADTHFLVSERQEREDSFTKLAHTSDTTHTCAHTQTRPKGNCPPWTYLRLFYNNRPVCNFLKSLGHSWKPDNNNIHQIFKGSLWTPHFKVTWSQVGVDCPVVKWKKMHWSNLQKSDLECNRNTANTLPYSCFVQKLGLQKTFVCSNSSSMQML